MNNNSYSFSLPSSKITSLDQSFLILRLNWMAPPYFTPHSYCGESIPLTDSCFFISLLLLLALNSSGGGTVSYCIIVFCCFARGDAKWILSTWFGIPCSDWPPNSTVSKDLVRDLEMQLLLPAVIFYIFDLLYMFSWLKATLTNCHLKKPYGLLNPQLRHHCLLEAFPYFFSKN